MPKLNFRKIFKNKKIIITGHTGFKGSWLTLWLNYLGAKVIGISNEIPTKPSFFKKLNLKNNCKSLKVNIKNLRQIQKIFSKEKPDFVFHLAAQSLVKKSYSNPINTFETNTLGTLNVLESLKKLKNRCNVVIITSDKSYKNIEKKNGYDENDVIGGHDPYSASKGAAEIIIQSYLKSYFSNNESKIKIAVARAGNVIGGGDWSSDRLIPDCVKSWSNYKSVVVRNPNSTRPWQHVLEALGGYLILATKLQIKKFHGEAFNFGPTLQNQRTVMSLIKDIRKFWPGIKWKIKKKENFYETKILNLNCSKSRKYLKWKCILKFEENIKMVAKWYKSFYFKKDNMKEFSIAQIIKYQKLMDKRL